MDTKHDNNIYIRLKECLANDWYDLAEHLNNITGALIDVPESGHAIRCELIGWCDEVDGRIETLTRAPSSSLDDNDSHLYGGVWGGQSQPESADLPQNTASFFSDPCGDKFGCES